MKKIFLILFTSAICLSACKETSTVEPQAVAVSSIQSLLSKNAPAVQKFTFNNESGTTILGTKGTSISIAPFTYGASSGVVTLSLKEVYTKNEMAAAGIFTSAYGSQMLNSQGMFELKASKNGAEVLPEKSSVVRMNIAPGTTPSETKIFKLVKLYDSASKTTTEEWVEYDENWDFDSSSQKKCKFNFKCITWCNLDAYMSNNGTSNIIKVSPPAGFGSSNMQVYFNLTGVNGLVSLYPNAISKTFNTYPIKAGYSGKIIMVAIKDNKYYRKVLDVTFTQSEQTFTLSTMDQVVMTDIETLLSSF